MEWRPPHWFENPYTQNSTEYNKEDFWGLLKSLIGCSQYWSQDQKYLIRWGKHQIYGFILLISLLKMIENYLKCFWNFLMDPLVTMMIYNFVL